MGSRDFIPKREEVKRLKPTAREVRKGLLQLLLTLAVLALALVFIEISLHLLGINVVFPDEIQFGELVTTVAPLLLSAVLVYLYYQQKEILSAEQRSMLSVNRFIGANEDVIDILISNSGSGPVYNVMLKVELEFDDGNISGRENILGLKATDDDGTDRSFVKPYEASTPFSKKVLLPIEFERDDTTEDSQRSAPFHIAMSFADDCNATSGHITLSIVWEDALQTEEMEILDEDFTVTRGQTLDDFLSNFPAHYRSA